MENNCLSQSSNNTKKHYRNYNLLDINEKIKILHKINSNTSHKYSFDSKINKNNNNINLLSSTLPSSNINKNININVYKKKLVKNNSTKNSPNILVLKDYKSETKDYNNKERIINEIKSDKILKQYIKDELKNEIIKEFLEDIADIDEQKVMNFLKIKNILMSSEKIKNEVIDNYNTKNKCIPDNFTSNITSSSNNIFNTDKRKERQKFIFNLDEVEKKKDLFNKRSINEISPVKTIFNNLFINNNEKYIIKNPFQEHDNKNINNMKRRKLFIRSNGEIKFSNFNFQIINNQKNYNKNNDSFYDFTSKSYISLLDDNNEKENISVRNIKQNEIIKEKHTNEIFESGKKKINNKIYYFSPVINNTKIKNNKRYLQNPNINNNEINDNRKKDNSIIIRNVIKEKINENKKEKKDNMNMDKNYNNIKKINIKTKSVKIEDEKRKKLIKKIIENSKKAIKNKNLINNNNYFTNLFFLKRHDRNKTPNGECLNKSVNFIKKNNIKLNQINRQPFSTYSEHKERNKTFTNFLNDKNSNIFRICHIKKYLKVFKKDNNKHLLNTKWLKNISKKNGPLLCFDKNKV